MIPDYELKSLIGTPIMSAISVLSSMGFRCADISKQTTVRSPLAVGTFSCRPADHSGEDLKHIELILPFSDTGIVTDVIKTEKPVDS
jgi:hypothetical protein